jgi:23S rRNA pseudoU1915 N3-methylase RlmH
MAATMMSEIERLVLSPFKEIVEKANNALDNAKAADNEDVAAAMLKAAQNLAKEGERALKRIEPLCHNNYQEYGANFINAIKEHGKNKDSPRLASAITTKLCNLGR